MNLYLISQNKNNDHDTYNEAVVVAKSEEEAKLIHPRGNSEYNLPAKSNDYWYYRDWVRDPKDVTVKLIGKAAKGISGVICASFNAG